MQNVDMIYQKSGNQGPNIPHLSSVPATWFVTRFHSAFGRFSMPLNLSMAATSGVRAAPACRGCVVLGLSYPRLCRGRSRRETAGGKSEADAG